MSTGHGSHHITPVSVGALMDPAFLSAAVRNANGDPAGGASTLPTMPRSLQFVVSALRAGAARLRRR